MLANARLGMSNPWLGPVFITGSSAADEAYADLRPYTDPGNPWINVSYEYIVDSSGFTWVHRRYANATTPNDWSDPPDVINSNDAGFGLNVRPRLSYSPGAPGTGAGAAFLGKNWLNAYFNAPWASAVEEPAMQPAAGPRFGVLPTVVGTQAAFYWQGPALALDIYDATGRLVRGFAQPAGQGLVWDRLDARGRTLAPGIYLARATLAAGTSAVALILK